MTMVCHCPKKLTFTSKHTDYDAVNVTHCSVPIAQQYPIILVYHARLISNSRTFVTVVSVLTSLMHPMNIHHRMVSRMCATVRSAELMPTGAAIRRYHVVVPAMVSLMKPSVYLV